MRTKSILTMLNILARPFGLAPHNNQGRLTLWYAVILIHTVVFCVSTVMLWVWKVRNVTFRIYAFQYMFNLALAMCYLGTHFCNATRIRGIIKLSTLEKMEKNLGNEIKYNTSFIVCNYCVTTVVYAVALVSFHRNIYSNLGTTPNITGAFAIILPRLVSHIGNMYYCVLVYIFKKQLMALENSELPINELIELHEFLLERCSALHASFRYQLIFGISETVTSMILGIIYAAAALKDWTKGTGNNAIERSVMTILELSISLIKLYFIATSCQGATTESRKLAADATMKMLNKSTDCENILPHHAGTTFKPHPSHDMIRLRIYALGAPEIDTSLRKYFTPDLSLFVTVIHTVVIYYLLMGDMGITEAKREFDSSWFNFR